MARMRRVVSIAAVAVIAVASAAITTGAAGARYERREHPHRKAGFDRWGGSLAVRLRATGYFRVERVRGQWWFVTPDGHPFFSAGVNTTTFRGTPAADGTAAYETTNLAKYGTRQVWADAQIERFRRWGFNTVGSWSDREYFAARDFPYTVNLDLGSQDWGTGAMDDLWAAAFEDRVRSRIASIVPAVRYDAAMVGYLLANELHWAPDWRPLHPFDQYLAMDASAPGKGALLRFLQRRYHSFSRFAAEVQTDATSWADLMSPRSVTAFSERGRRTRQAWLSVMAERFFSFTDAVLTQADPNHLNLGARFMAQVVTPGVAAAAGRHVDVMSVNFYDVIWQVYPFLDGLEVDYLPVDGMLAAHHAMAPDVPVMVTEWGYRAADSGLPNTFPPLYPTLADQDERAAAFRNYMQCVIDAPWLVGAHWFEHADQPAAGRFDGENNNFGLVTEGDEVYEEVVAASAEMHRRSYARLRGRGYGPCTDIGPSGTAQAP